MDFLRKSQNPVCQSLQCRSAIGTPTAHCSNFGSTRILRGTVTGHKTGLGLLVAGIATQSAGNGGKQLFEAERLGEKGGGAWWKLLLAGIERAAHENDRQVRTTLA